MENSRENNESTGKERRASISPPSVISTCRRGFITHETMTSLNKIISKGN